MDTNDRRDPVGAARYTAPPPYLGWDQFWKAQRQSYNRGRRVDFIRVRSRADDTATEFGDAAGRKG